MKKNLLVGMITAAAILMCVGCAGRAESNAVPGDLFANLNTVDFEGNTVTADVFKENDLTLINTCLLYTSRCV